MFRRSMARVTGQGVVEHDYLSRVSRGLECLDSPTSCLAGGSSCLTVVPLKAFSKALRGM